MTQRAETTGEEEFQSRTDLAVFEDEGYKKGLGNRQVQMIAIGGAIGSGLFLGAGGRLHSAGPALMIVYAVAGAIAFLVVRAMGEMVMHRPTSGSFVSYSREFIGEKSAYFAGWMYFLNWACSGMGDVTAAAVYVRFFAPDVPQWIPALIALGVVLAVNLVSVKVFGELEFWFAAIKVAALVIFMIIAIVTLVSRTHVDGYTTGPQLIFQNGGFFPAGFLAVLMILQGVVFAYAGVEMVGVAAGETDNPRKVIPKAVNSVGWRIAVFYVGSVLLLVMLLPSFVYQSGQSPFVTLLSKIGVPGAAAVMNLVVLTAALSSVNSGLYTTGRVLRSLAFNGSAPRMLSRMSKSGVPYAGILLTASIYLIGVALNAFFSSARRLRNRHRALRGGHHRHVVDDHDLALGDAAGGGRWPDRTTGIPAARRALHELHHPRVPRARPRDDVVQRVHRQDRHLLHPTDRGGADRRLVRGARQRGAHQGTRVRQAPALKPPGRGHVLVASTGFSFSTRSVICGVAIVRRVTSVKCGCRQPAVHSGQTRTATIPLVKLLKIHNSNTRVPSGGIAGPSIGKLPPGTGHSSP
ncbi:amino acid permease [Fodinicola feengrottensis]